MFIVMRHEIEADEVVAVFDSRDEAEMLAKHLDGGDVLEIGVDVPLNPQWARPKDGCAYHKVYLEADGKRPTKWPWYGGICAFYSMPMDSPGETIEIYDSVAHMMVEARSEDDAVEKAEQIAAKEIAEGRWPFGSKGEDDEQKEGTSRV